MTQRRSFFASFRSLRPQQVEVNPELSARREPRPPMRRWAFAARTHVLSITCLFAALLFVIPGGRCLTADDDDALDRELLDSLEGRPPVESPERIIPRLIERTSTATDRLAAGQLDQQTSDLQAQILQDIDALLEQGAPPQPPQQNQPPSGSPQQNPQQQQQASSSQDQQKSSQENDSSQSEGQNDPNAAAGESQERSTPGQAGESERERRLGLSTAAWGHLPPKVREQMRSAFSEEYLPEYDALVRRYYEALARRRSADRDRPSGQ